LSNSEPNQKKESLAISRCTEYPAEIKKPHVENYATHQEIIQCWQSIIKSKNHEDYKDKDKELDNNPEELHFSEHKTIHNPIPIYIHW